MKHEEIMSYFMFREEILRKAEEFFKMMRENEKYDGMLQASMFLRLKEVKSYHNMKVLSVSKSYDSNHHFNMEIGYPSDPKNPAIIMSRVPFEALSMPKCPTVKAYLSNRCEEVLSNFKSVANSKKSELKTQSLQIDRTVSEIEEMYKYGEE